MKPLQELFAGRNIVAAVRTEAQLRQAVQSPVAAIFLLQGDINNIRDLVDFARGHGKPVFPHLDLLGGIAGDRAGLEFIAREVAPDGIITTRSSLVKAGKKLGLRTIQRLFLLDSTAVETGIHALMENQPDAVEVMPGCLPKTIRRLRGRISIPIIAGGLIDEGEEIRSALAAGAMAVSVGKGELWCYNDGVQEN